MGEDGKLTIFVGVSKMEIVCGDWSGWLSWLFSFMKYGEMPAAW